VIQKLATQISELAGTRARHWRYHLINLKDESTRDSDKATLYRTLVLTLPQYLWAAAQQTWQNVLSISQMLYVALRDRSV
jgi:hypothetical protein